ncbi:BLUF domain-containing protein [Variovorax sp. RHLX14]|uniref:BLUF domain-containing protein n=1 Tax=Variovorax sp. RHLX14 TaxID=1259731 RepID=UPI003F472AC0
MLNRLIYTSRAAGASPLHEILAASIAWNKAHEITGGLVCVEGTYLQYLEGEQEAVDQVFAMISRDSRHDGVKILERRAVQRRMFTDWSMAVLDWNDETRAIFKSFSPGQRVDLYGTDPTTAAPLFRAWVATPHWKTGVITA